MRTSWVCGLLGVTAVIAIGSSRAEAAYCLQARSDISPRIVSYSDVGAFVRYGQPGLREFAMLGRPLAASEPQASPLAHEVMDVSEEAVLSGVRVVARVQLSREADEAELRSIGDEIVQRERSRRRLNAIAVVYYLAAAATVDACALGTAVWAPNGNWDAARTVRLGDYSRHRLVVDSAAHRGQEGTASVVRSSAVIPCPPQARTAGTNP